MEVNFIKGKGLKMKKNNVVHLINFARKPAGRKFTADTDRLLHGYKRLSRKEKEILLTILDAFVLGKLSAEQAE